VGLKNKNMSKIQQTKIPMVVIDEDNLIKIAVEQGVLKTNLIGN
jgi:hypothetical protein